MRDFAEQDIDRRPGHSMRIAAEAALDLGIHLDTERLAGATQDNPGSDVAGSTLPAEPPSGHRCDNPPPSALWVGTPLPPDRWRRVNVVSGVQERQGVEYERTYAGD